MALADHIDLKVLAARESEQVEWKENVADVDDVVATLSAFANDWANLGGGYVVCGAKEERDEHGFPRLAIVGLTAARLKEVEARVLAGCRDRVSPSIAPIVEELPTDSPERRVLVFTISATRTAHQFRRGDGSGEYFVRISRETREARNGIFLQLMVNKGAIDAWDRRICQTATVDDLDLLALRDALQRMELYDPDLGVDQYLSDTKPLNAFVPPLCAKEPLTGILRPRNFAMLLFGLNVQLHIPGAVSLFSIYPGTDRSDANAARHELAGTLIDQARKLLSLLDTQSYTAFDKNDRIEPNAISFPTKALHEATVNALVHRDYEMVDPMRITVFANRIEFLSPGSLPLGISIEDLKAGRAYAKWRNQTLAWFMNRLELAQAEGQGIKTILRSMRVGGCPPPQFEVRQDRVLCTLYSHPRHALAKLHQQIVEALAIGDLELAQTIIAPLLQQDPMNVRTVQLFVSVQAALKSIEPVRDFVRNHESQLSSFPPEALLALAGMLDSNKDADLEKRLVVGILQALQKMIPSI